MTVHDLNTDSLAGLGKGSGVWYKEAASSWVAASLAQAVGPEPSPEDVVDVVLESGASARVPLGSLVPANPEVLDGVEDLTHLTFLNEPGVLHDLHTRYEDDQIYTFAGPVLIAVNPCKDVPLYTSEVAARYRAIQHDAQAQLDPHIFLVAGKAFKAMCDTAASQSIIISGESGAGKTENTKKAMQYFATLAGGTGVEDQVLQTNPLLEAFGNAKTLRNHNSSRFGKLIEIHFNNTRHICGALIKTYLLEKSRVAHQNKGERNFHIMYQLVRGASQKEREAFFLPNDVSAFEYLNQSGCDSITGVDDAAGLAEVKDAMTVIGISKEDQEQVFKTVAAVLWLGNVKMVADGNDGARCSKGDALRVAAQLLGVSASKLERALTHTHIKVGGEVIVKPLTAQKSAGSRDALAKALYSALFDWLVARVNDRLASGKHLTGLSINILDIYGFESFQRNSFEQLCINYANERLQQQFNAHLFKLEQEEYSNEGIDWAHVPFDDNQECLDLIEKRHAKMIGILAILNEESTFPQATDATFAAKLAANLKQHPHFGVKPGAPMDFSINHYAGPVTYTATDFLDKNKDQLGADLADMLALSRVPLAATLAAAISAAGASSRRGATVAQRFTEQLRDLVARLDETALHFIRCIKPNVELAPTRFDAGLILGQLRCCGVLEVVRISKAGYPTRYFFKTFSDRYAILLPGALKGGLPAKRSPLDTAKALVATFGLPQEQYRVGRTKVFFRAGVLGAMEDLYLRIQRSVLTLQARWRGFTARRAFLQARSAAVLIQAVERGRLAREMFVELKRNDAAARTVQRAYRAHLAHVRYAELVHHVVYIQCAWRRKAVRTRVARRVAAREKAEAAEREKKEKMMAEQGGWEAIQAHFGMDALQIRAEIDLWLASKDEYLAWKASGGELTPEMLAAAQGGLSLDESDELKSKVADLEIQLQREKVRADTAEATALASEQDLYLVSKTLHQQMSLMRKALGEMTAKASAETHNPEKQDINGMPLPSNNHLLHRRRPPRAAEPKTTEGRAVARVRKEYDDKVAVYEDDCDFIAEVALGEVEAPDMNPEAELYQLKQRFDKWKIEYKAKLKQTRDLLRPPAFGAHARPRHPRHSHNEHGRHGAISPTSPTSPNSNSASVPARKSPAMPLLVQPPPPGAASSTMAEADSPVPPYRGRASKEHMRTSHDAGPRSPASGTGGGNVRVPAPGPYDPVDSGAAGSEPSSPRGENSSPAFAEAEEGEKKKKAKGLKKLFGRKK